MTQFLLDTLLWTGVLIALVLVLRRPVARQFGPQAAYALWFLPLIRLFMPPIVLPAWLKPEEPAAETTVAAMDASLVAVEGSATLARTASTTPIPLPSPVDFVIPLVIIWMVGAAVFLIRRFSLYFEMRRDLLAEARPVGDAGKARIVETPAADGPVAFGVIDKVIALPPGFMASRDRTARDLALEHEIAHHRGQDLLVNFLVQPLFAIHWFNPLGWTGWRAMRRDQEAACDARVLATRPREEKATYAGVIASLATSANGNSRLALAAPMACPVLGDKSIIHRLRSISVSDISTRRRLSGRALLLVGALALPLTASISYASAQDVPAPPAPPAPTANVPVPPTPPVPPAPVVPPAPPLPTAVQVAPEVEIDIDADEDVEAEMERLEEKLEKQEEARERRMMRIEQRIEKDAKERERRIEKRVHRQTHKSWSKEDKAKFRQEMKELRTELAADGQFHKEMKLAIAEANAQAPEVVVKCRTGQTEVVEEGVSDSGQNQLFVCKANAMKHARKAIASARAAVEGDDSLSASERAEALRSLDEASRSLDREG